MARDGQEVDKRDRDGLHKGGTGMDNGWQGMDREWTRDDGILGPGPKEGLGGQVGAERVPAAKKIRKR